MKVSVAKCTCGRLIFLSQQRNEPKLATICINCFRSLWWKDKKPIAISYDQGKRIETQVEIVGLKEIN